VRGEVCGGAIRDSGLRSETTGRENGEAIMTEEQLREDIPTVVALLLRAITNDSDSKVTTLPEAGGQTTLVLSAPASCGTGRLLGKNGETFRSLERVLTATGYACGTQWRLVVDDPRKHRRYESEQHYKKYR
jgi:hypothetical protein